MLTPLLLCRCCRYVLFIINCATDSMGANMRVITFQFHHVGMSWRINTVHQSLSAKMPKEFK